MPSWHRWTDGSCCESGSTVSPSKRFELDFVGRNVFDKQYTTSVNVNSNGSIGYDGMGEPRWVGVELHAKL